LSEKRRSPKKWVVRAHALLDSSLQSPMHEVNEVDWKVELSSNKSRLVEHLCAFANYAGGGYLVYGIDNDGRIIGVGQSDVQSIVNNLANLGRDAVEPALQLDHALLDLGVGVLLVHIPESATKPVHRRGKQLDDSFIRSGGTTRKASRQEIGTMMLHSKTPGWEELHATLLQSDEEILALLEVAPIFQLLNRPIPQDMEAVLDWMAEEFFIQRPPFGRRLRHKFGRYFGSSTTRELPRIEPKGCEDHRLQWSQ
jgi:ATP-dependent DNA helicase RecG